MMCDRACTPPRGYSPTRCTSGCGSSHGRGALLLEERDANTMPPRKKASRVERRLGLEEEEDDDDTENDDTDVGTGPFSTPRGSWPLSTQPPLLPEQEETTCERPSDNSLGRLTAQDYAGRAVPDCHSNRASLTTLASSRPGQQCWQTPEVNRFGIAARMTGGNFGQPVVPSLLYTPQIAPGLQTRRGDLDAELDPVNNAHRMYPMPPVTPLLPGKLYIGGYPDDETLPVLRAEGIRYIINCASQDFVTERAVAAEFCVVDMEAFDSADYLILHHDFDNFARIVDDIVEHKQEKVFVHCIAGINRSVTLCCAYLMEKLRCSPVDVVRLFRANGRMRILENVSFRHQLVDHYLQVVAPLLNDEEEADANGQPPSATQKPSGCGPRGSR